MSTTEADNQQKQQRRKRVREESARLADTLLNASSTASAAAMGADDLLNLALRRRTPGYQDPEDSPTILHWDVDPLGRPAPSTLVALKALGCMENGSYPFQGLQFCDKYGRFWMTEMPPPPPPPPPPSSPNPKERTKPDWQPKWVEWVPIFVRAEEDDDNYSDAKQVWFRPRKEHDRTVSWVLKHGLGLKRETFPTHIDGYGRGLPDRSTIDAMEMRGLVIPPEEGLFWRDKAGRAWRAVGDAVRRGGVEWRREKRYDDDDE